MPRFLMRRWHGYHVVSLFLLAALCNAFLTYYQWKIGVLGYCLLGLLVIYALQARKSFKKDLEKYISTLTHRVNKAGKEAVTELPIGILLYNEDYEIQWANPFIMDFLPREFLGESLESLSKNLLSAVKKGETETELTLEGRYYSIRIRQEERLLYFFDMTETQATQELYQEEQTVIGLIYLDNYDEVTQGMDDQIRSKLLSHVTSSLNYWANEHQILLRSISSDRFIAVMNKKALDELEKTRFELLDEVREVTGKEKVSITLSIGIGSGGDSLRELGDLAQSSLDLALGRGGDQVAIKETNGKVRFYGGKSNAMEKRTRVRARVISHALRDFVLESDQVIIMGHKNPDMDAIGAAIGVLKIAAVNNTDAYVVVDPNDINPDVQKLMEEVGEHEDLWKQFITPDDALDELTRHTLLVVVDTHKPSLVIEPRLVDAVNRVVVLDHHRRGEEIIKDPVLVYMEPYASSTAELVTELLEYQPQKLNMDVLEATAMLAGIIVDTKSFAIRTGSRTFDAASFLKSHGADTTLVQMLLKEDIEQYVRRSRLIEKASIYRDGMAIAKASGEETFDQILIAQAADTLLTMNDVKGSFVISKRQDGKVSISARSLGEVNVQIIMEALNGGGHLTNAATQIEGVSIDEAEEMLMQAIDDYLEGGTKE
ncbi:c-di-AMP phosphodiesterase, consists of a GGDEF-like and DHH domains [Alteribacillus persepolensis]|uniref:Cyclic-di-AMP phosphodiesterase n=1 Tax=Alteribacillus persepolensis TaxID=568899 RepID=A0A1G8K8V8_9BACI|nr:DHH family phosphoesterase [Alteribacillus persepolensis]SDI39864.1 c-di-AMP phosphodiesterase, consists of a GGDEF-like and DHH domains [Alteribacillus persepolensis]